MSPLYRSPARYSLAALCHEARDRRLNVQPGGQVYHDGDEVNLPCVRSNASCARNFNNVKNTVFEVKVNAEASQKYSRVLGVFSSAVLFLWLEVEFRKLSLERVGFRSWKLHQRTENHKREERDRLVRSLRLYRGSAHPSGVVKRLIFPVHKASSQLLLTNYVATIVR